MEIREAIAKSTHPSTEINIKYVLFSVSMVLVGAGLSWYVRKVTDQKLQDSITAEINALQAVQSKTALTTQQQQQLNSLNAQKQVVAKIQARNPLVKKTK